ncbi:MAG: hypothetical protein KDC82_08830, partial [Bacteroidetes bacterium]|nr:hypothetical protein [Bacteroidota bacterium]
MQVAVYGRKLKDSAASEAMHFFNLLQAKGIDFTVYSPFLKHLNKDLGLNLEFKTFTLKKEITKSIYFVFSLGGDGTILDAVS